MKRLSRMPAWLNAGLIATAFGVLVWLERRRPLRRRAIESKLTRDARNLTIAILGAVALQIAEQAVVDSLARMVERRRLGLLKRIPLHPVLEVALAVVLLDYTLYVWHVLTHRLALLWRFHLVHHIDLDMDASTALRFHFGELVFSVPWHAGQIVLIGISPQSLTVWRSLLLLSILFHHSNVRLPIKTERRLNRFIVTPRMHGIHHSIVPEEADSNWSSGLTIWDRLHGTLRLNVPQDEIVIGVPAYRDAEEVRLARVFVMPFEEQRPSWQLPGNGKPVRPALLVPADQLLP
jgi:sterol desaturase/sphingolipid hydroxylase (fatty acid hydroxylase superfamily)